ncbi:ThiF family adenylyltransferase [Bacillus velezensis]|uniref:ThiF family adenylyltransferase n=1 Tax=Bacillus velezensis TaxID=492670 RepID=UPI002E243982|nr:ThiF family adenylyltransferase [Bacillus velezensis]
MMSTDCKRWKFKDSVQVLTYTAHIIIQYRKAIKLAHTSEIKEAVERLITGCEKQELSDLLGEEAGNQFFDALMKLDALIEPWQNGREGRITEKQLYHFEKYNQNPNLIQKRLDGSRAAIVGLGGVGTIILQNLLAAGMQHFILIDFDAVSVHNLNRQFVYNKSSVGKLKISECRDYIAGVNPNADAALYHKEMTQPQDLRVLDPYEIDIVINAADKPHNISEWVYRYCKERNIAFMTGGVGSFSGQWGPLLTPESYQSGITYEKNMPAGLLNCYPDEPIKGSLGATNGIISSFMSHDIITYLAGGSPKSLNTRIGLDFDGLHITETKLSQKESAL